MLLDLKMLLSPKMLLGPKDASWILEMLYSFGRGISGHRTVNAEGSPHNTGASLIVAKKYSNQQAIQQMGRC